MNRLLFLSSGGCTCLPHARKSSGPLATLTAIIFDVLCSELGSRSGVTEEYRCPTRAHHVFASVPASGVCGAITKLWSEDERSDRSSSRGSCGIRLKRLAFQRGCRCEAAGNNLLFTLSGFGSRQRNSLARVYSAVRGMCATWLALLERSLRRSCSSPGT